MDIAPAVSEPLLGWCNRTSRNKLQWNFNRNSKIFIQENTFENIVWKKTTILSRPLCVKTTPMKQSTTQPYAYFKSLWPYQDDVIKWKLFLRYRPFVRGIHRSLVNSPHKSQWRGNLMFFLDYVLNKRLSKQSWGWWFETPLCKLWRHCNG